MVGERAGGGGGEDAARQLRGVDGGEGGVGAWRGWRGKVETRRERLRVRVAALGAWLAGVARGEGAGSRLLAALGLGWVGGAERIHYVWSCVRAHGALRTLW